MAENAIEIKGLRKSYGEKEVLKGIDFTVKKGEILALLGPNGAGKTTTIRILATLLNPDGGTAIVNGHDVVEAAGAVRTSIGLTGQYAAVDEYLTGFENLALIGNLYHLPKATSNEIATRLIEEVDLVEASSKPVKTYSGGMKRRLDLAMSLIANPPIIFLDEPTTGLDPRSRMHMWEMVKKLAANGTTILLTTQYMEEADYLADNIIVIDHGVVIAEGTASELKSKVGSDRLDIVLDNQSDFARALDVIDGDGVKSNEEERTISVNAQEGVKNLQAVLAQLEDAHITVETISLRRPTLDDVFLTLTGRETAEEVLEEDAKGKK
jgi:ABC-2 type transport system ATP-binding protein